MNHKHSMVTRPQRPRGQGRGRARLLTPGRVPGPGPASPTWYSSCCRSSWQRCRRSSSRPSSGSRHSRTPWGKSVTRLQGQDSSPWDLPLHRPTPQALPQELGTDSSPHGPQIPHLQNGSHAAPTPSQGLVQSRALSTVAWGRLHTGELLPTHSAAPCCHLFGH